MDITPQDRFKIASNIIARSGGLEGIDLRAELAKAESRLHQMGAQMNTPTMPNEDDTAPFSPSIGDNTTQGEIMPQTSQNPPQNEGVNEGVNMG